MLYITCCSRLGPEDSQAGRRGLDARSLNSAGDILMLAAENLVTKIELPRGLFCLDHRFAPLTVGAAADWVPGLYRPTICRYPGAARAHRGNPPGVIIGYFGADRLSPDYDDRQILPTSINNQFNPKPRRLQPDANLVPTAIRRALSILE